MPPVTKKPKPAAAAAPDTCPHCGAAINAASLLAKRPSPLRVAAARRAATFPRPGRSTAAGTKTK